MIIGVDEVNFSPSLAGDCVVCALAAHKKIEGVKDSKQLTPGQRLKLFGELQENSYYSIAPATINDINQLGIYEARNLAIENSARSLVNKLKFFGQKFPIARRLIEVEKIIIDGYFSKTWILYFQSAIDIQTESIVDGDQKVYEISAASIVAKVYVDALFQGYGSFYPGYNLEINHGSPDEKIYEKIRKSGATPIHRQNYGLGWWKKIYDEVD